MTLAAELRQAAHDPGRLDALLAGRETPLVDGDQVTFVYRGDARQVTLQHFIYGLETSRPFERVDGSPLWLLTLDLPRESRIEYKLGLTEGEHTRWIRDPLNPKLAHDPFGANSVCQTAGYAAPAWAVHDPDVPAGELHELSIDSTHLGDTRLVTVYLPPRFRRSRRYPLLIAHDGHDFLRFSQLSTVLDNLIAAHEVAPMIVALTTSTRRLHEYAADRAHADFLTHELLPTLEARLPLKTGARHRGLMGASFGGVASLSTAWYHPGVYGRLLLQSGSFAFTDIGTHQRGPAFDPVVVWMNAFRAKPGTPTEKAFVTCGVYESLIYENRSLIPVLQAAGVDVRFAEARDGHNWVNWRDRLRDGLTWLFPGPLEFVYE